MAKIAVPSLASLDPSEAWAPWKPDAKNPWGLKWAGHLYRRAAFGARWDELKQAVKNGPKDTLALLIAGGPDPDEIEQSLDEADNGISGDNQRSTLQEAQGVWLARMVRSPYPLRERMTLFWHNHFATSVAKVQVIKLMQQQVGLSRTNALGNFRAFVLEMSRNPAMMKWLDSNDNVKGRPNENYARELMELFTLGVGHYTEKDVQEAARAFTGWHTSEEEFVFNKAQHDEGTKTILGQTGNWDGTDVLRMLLEQPACARFLVRKLFRYFISESADPTDALIEPLSEQLRKSDYDIGGVVRTMLRSRLFFSDHACRQRIKSPTEYIVGVLHSLEPHLEGQAIFTSLAQVMDGLGQTLYAPPNVKGWDGGKAWLNSATVLARHNLAWSFVGGLDGRFSGKIDPGVLVQKHAGSEPDKQVAFLLDLLLEGNVSPRAREKLVTFLQSGKTRDGGLNKALRETTHNILLMPEYQLC